MKKTAPTILLFMLLTTVFRVNAFAEQFEITVAPNHAPCVMHGAKVLQEKLEALGHTVEFSDDLDAAPDGVVKIVIGSLSGFSGETVLPDGDSLIDLLSSAGPEAYAISLAANTIFAIGSDDVGAMYAAYDVAEQIEMDALKKAGGINSRFRQPGIELRAVNQFLQVQAFNDPDSWYFDEEYWATYLDELSIDRFNLLDVHAMYDLNSTQFPNCYLYLLWDEKYPGVGVGREQAEKSLAMFNRIVDMAMERGIRTSLMSYHASWSLTGYEEDAEQPTDAELEDYTAIMVRKTIDLIPGLWMVGFRIGETGRSGDFFERSYIRGINEAGREIFLFTRTWHATSEQVLSIPEAYPDRTYVEIKYNGEHLGLPYQAMTYNRHHAGADYTWEFYSNWPRKYKILWQIRANGTHRLFRWADPEFARRSVNTSHLADGAGFTLEPMSSYYPPTDFFYNPAKNYDYFTWDHQRNWLWYMLWGRLSYNPDEPRAIWINRLRTHYGDAAEDTLDMLTSMSKIVPLVYSWRCIGVDHRDMAPEYETGGDLLAFADNYPLDPESIHSIDSFTNKYLYKDEYLGAQLDPFRTADILDSYAENALAAAERARAKVNSPNKEFESLLVEMQATVHLARYYSNKIRAATYLDFFRKKAALEDLEAAEKFMALSLDEWKLLSNIGDEYFGQILDTLRMRKFVEKLTFTWSELTPSLDKDLEILAAERARLEDIAARAAKEPAIGHRPAFIAPAAKPLEIKATIPGADESTVARLSYREKGESEFTNISMERIPDQPLFTAFIPADAAHGELEYFIAAKLGGNTARYPGKPVPDNRESNDFDIQDYYYGNAREDTIEQKKLASFEKQKYVPVTFATESAPPAITPVSAEIAPGGESVTLTVKVEDASDIAEVLAFHKIMPTYYTWEKDAMKPASDGLFKIELPLTPEGMLYYFKAVDVNLNSTAYPDFLEATPYIVIESWDPDNNPH